MATFYRCDRCCQEMSVREVTAVTLINADRREKWEVCGCCARAIIKFCEKLAEEAKP